MRIIRYQTVECRQCLLVVADFVVGARQLIQHPIIAGVIRVDAQKILVDANRALVVILIEFLISTGALDIQIPKPP